MRRLRDWSLQSTECLASTTAGLPRLRKEAFLRRWKGKLFGKDEDRDDLQFWEQEKSIFLEEFPQHRDVFDGMDGGDVELVD